MHKFKAEIYIIGINPFVFVPDEIWNDIFKEAGTDKGHIPISGTVNNKAYQQTLLVKYGGSWRLYINTTMLKNSPKRIGETVEITIAYDPADRSIAPHPKLAKALAENTEAKSAFDKLSPSSQKEMARYISRLKTEQSIDRNVEKAIHSLLGQGRFVGRESLK